MSGGAGMLLHKWKVHNVKCFSFSTGPKCQFIGGG